MIIQARSIPVGAAPNFLTVVRREDGSVGYVTHLSEEDEDLLDGPIELNTDGLTLEEVTDYVEWLLSELRQDRMYRVLGEPLWG